MIPRWGLLQDKGLSGSQAMAAKGRVHERSWEGSRLIYAEYKPINRDQFLALVCLFLHGGGAI